MEILLQDEHLCNATVMILLWTQNIHFLWPILKHHLHTNMILMLEILTLENAWNISQNALLMTSSLAIVFLKYKKEYWVLFSKSKTNKQTTPILTTVPRHPNRWQQIQQLLLTRHTKSKCCNTLF